jgi:hypothetical protein
VGLTWSSYRRAGFTLRPNPFEQGRGGLVVWILIHQLALKGPLKNGLA